MKNQEKNLWKLLAMLKLYDESEYPAIIMLEYAKY